MMLMPTKKHEMPITPPSIRDWPGVEKELRIGPQWRGSKALNKDLMARADEIFSKLVNREAEMFTEQIISLALLGKALGREEEVREKYNKIAQYLKDQIDSDSPSFATKAFVNAKYALGILAMEGDFASIHVLYKKLEKSDKAGNVLNPFLALLGLILGARRTSKVWRNYATKVNAANREAISGLTPANSSEYIIPPMTGVISCLVGDDRTTTVFEESVNNPNTWTDGIYGTPNMIDIEFSALAGLFLALRAGVKAEDLAAERPPWVI